MKKFVNNVSASILSRLLNYSRKKHENYQFLLIRYISERFLYRLGKSKYHEQLILKGAYLLTVMLQNQTYRATKDIDFLKTGDTISRTIIEALRDICSIEYPEDGVSFDLDSIRLEDIREQNDYHGQHAKIIAYIGKTRSTLHIDIGFGDIVYPNPGQLIIPSILDQSAAIISSYPIESVIAEKLEAIISISLLTSRMKDFYDLYAIVSCMKVNYKSVCQAITKTFNRRGTEIPRSMPDVFSAAVFEDYIKKKQWGAFIQKIRTGHPSLNFHTVISKIQDFSTVFWDHNVDKNIRQWLPNVGWQ